jgi:pyruvate dehydrogenase E1 component alpha subunit
MQAHTNADDDTRYRPGGEVEAWMDRDPLLRSEAYLKARGLLTDERQAAFAEHAEDVAAGMRDGLMADIEPDPADLFDHVYASPTPQLREQAAFLAEELSREEAR